MSLRCLGASIKSALPFLLLMATQVEGGLAPFFSKEHSAWHATDIVVGNGKGVVVETWKGSLLPGADVSNVTKSLPRKPTVSDNFRGQKKDGPLILSGNRVLLFLIRQTESTGKPKWKPANRSGGLKVSVAWIESSKIYAYGQIIIPGPSVLVPFGTVKLFKKQVQTILRAQREVRNAAKTKSPRDRAKQMVVFFDSEVENCRLEAFQVIGKCGNAAMPVLRGLLSQPKRLSMHNSVVAAMVSAVGENAKLDLLKLVQVELAYWKMVAPGFERLRGHGPMDGHYSRLHEALYQLTKLNVSKNERPPLISLRKLWVSQPQLNSRIVTMIDEVIAGRGKR